MTKVTLNSEERVRLLNLDRSLEFCDESGRTLGFFSPTIEGTGIRKSTIHDRGRGPEIEGTRITVYDVMDYYTDGWPATRIAARLSLGTPDIEAAIEYIEAHRAEVDAEYRKIVECSERGNSPEVEAIYQATLPLVRAKMAEVLRLARERKSNATCPNGAAK